MKEKVARYIGARLTGWTDENEELVIGIDNHRSVAKTINKLTRGESRKARKKLFDERFDSLLAAHGTVPADLPSIKDGWCHIPREKNLFEGIDTFVDLCNEIIDSTQKTSDYKSYFKPISTAEYLETKPILLDFATNPALLKIVGEYIQTIPVLKYLNAIISPPVEADAAGSQLFHLDVEAERVARVVVMLDDITEAHGPFTFLPESLSKQAKKALNYGDRNVSYRVKDEDMFKVVSPDQLMVGTGKKGDVLICDTSNCFHYGSRGQTEPRRVAMISFSPDILENYHFLLKQKDRKMFRGSKKPTDSFLRKMVLDDLCFEG